MARTGIARQWSERGKVLLGVLALLLGATAVWLLGTLGVGRDAGAMALGVAAVALLVVGTLSLGTSESARV